MKIVRSACSARLASVIILALLSLGSSAQGADEPRRLISLMDYLGGDYGNAVQGGKIVSQDEFGEMQEFAKRSLELLALLKKADGADRAGIAGLLSELTKKIDDKSDAETIAQLTKQIKDKVLSAYSIVPYPRKLPALASGKKLYLENCAQCHGETGKGDGTGRESMKPKTPLPANFTDPERMAGISPFKAFNTQSFGLEGTAMASFAALSEEQRWELAFYIMSLRFTREHAALGANQFREKNLPADITTVATLATLSDGELTEKLKTHFKEEALISNILAYLRRGLIEQEPTSPLVVTRTLLRESSELYIKGEREKSYQKAIEAYLDGYELAEPTVVAKNAALGRSIEAQMTQFRNAIKQGVSPEEIQKRHIELEVQLTQAAELGTAGNEGYSHWYFFLNSALIILREGLEASLVIAAILAMLKVLGATGVARYIHLGWILALAGGGITWWLTQTVLTLSGQSRESMEGFIALFAAVALFYVGYWLHTRSEAKKWQAFIHDKVENVVTGRRILGLVGISFFAVYREAFEVVLFYQALWLQNESGHSAILWGLVAGSVLLVLITFAIIKLGLHIPLKYFFGATGTLLYIMAFIFAGNGISALQAAGWMPLTPIGFPPQVPLLGIYPTLESIAAQTLMLIAFIATFFWLAHERKAR